jgi:HEAT repeat protein
MAMATAMALVTSPVGWARAQRTPSSKSANAGGAAAGVSTGGSGAGSTAGGNGTVGAGVTPASDLRGRFGSDLAVHLLQSIDPDDRLRGLSRAASLRTPEGLALLERASKARIPGAPDPHVPVEGVARRDPRALLVTVRGLADWLDREPARAALAAIVDAPTQSFDARPTGLPGADPSGDEADGAARIWLARQQAAIALAESGNLFALEALIAIGRSSGAGQGPALDALAIHPPASPLLGGVVLTTSAMIGLAAAVGDLRSLDAIRSALSVSDPALRAAALRALGTAGDARAAEPARASQHDPDPRVRIAAAEALVRLGTRDAAAAVEALIGDEDTALGGLRLGRLVQSEGVTKAAAARAVVSSNDEVRAAAIATLGRQSSPAAISALLVLAGDPGMQGDAACAIARSPSAAALSGIQTLADAAPSRRLAGRAYFARRLLRAERTAPLDALLESLAGAHDPRDRAVGVEARVALGELPVAVGLGDPDPRVRRAAALGAHATDDAATQGLLLARLSAEPDETTRRLLAIGLVGGDPTASVPTMDLVRGARGGGPEAPLMAYALARRGAADPGAGMGSHAGPSSGEETAGDAAIADTVDALLASRDPLLRLHAARGLGASRAPDAAGRLARAYEREGDVAVRRAIVTALADLGGEGRSSADWTRTLELAARLEPDRAGRWVAARALSGLPVPPSASGRDLTWVRLVPAQGASLPPAMTGAVVTRDDVALPIGFDDDGYALLPGVPDGDAQLRLAPRPPAYEALGP